MSGHQGETGPQGLVGALHVRGGGLLMQGNVATLRAGSLGKTKWEGVKIVGDVGAAYILKRGRICETLEAKVEGRIGGGSRRA